MKRSTQRVAALLSLPIAFAAAAVDTAPPASAALTYTDCATVENNLVTNCGFEEGTTGWGISSGGYVLATDAHSGTSAWRSGVRGYGHAFVFQDLVTVPDVTYDVSYFLKGRTGYGQQFRVGVDLDGPGPDDPVILDDISAETFADYTQRSREFTATGTTTTLTFHAGRSIWQLDDVVVAVKNQAPVCTAASPSTDTLWPPTNKFLSIEVLGVTDPDNDTTTITIDSIFQDEPVTGPGDASPAPDATGVGTSIAQIRAERAGNGDGRAYHIGFTATDTSEATCTGTLTVTVPHDQATTAIDGGTLFDSTTT